MTDKDKGKRFPLSLSSVAGKSVTEKSRHAARVATPQTATRNAAKNNAVQGIFRSEVGSGSAAVAGRLESVSRAQLAGSIAVGPKSHAPLAPEQAGQIMASQAVRKAMVNRIASQGVKDAQVLMAMESIPRHMFLEPAMASQAYIDASLPIGHHQTISQPYIVARMIEILRDNKRGGSLDRVLEIGTGCGYQAAVLSRIAKEVYSIERIKPLHELAKSNLRPLRIANIRLHYGDGMIGLPQVAPFDGIILAAAGLEVPKELLEQMNIGGRLIAPVGGSSQMLQLVERKARHEWTTTGLETCHFVPLRPGVSG